MEKTFSGEVEFHEERERVDRVTTDDGDELLDRHVSNLEPGTLLHIAQQLHSRNPNKRLIVHFMQPHQPYTGKKARAMRESVEEEENILFDQFHTVSEIDATEKRVMGSLINAAEAGIISRRDLEEIYVENLASVLSHVQSLVESLDGKTIITSDHGEMLGESNSRITFGHHPKVYLEDLRKVPWLTINSDERKDIVVENLSSRDTLTDEDIDEQLELLGYK